MNGCGRTGENRSIVVIEANRQMQHLLRSMLANFGQRSVRIFADTESAVAAMLSDVPAMVLLDWDAGPYRGRDFLKLIRHRKMSPLCLVPIIVLLSQARQGSVEAALRLGAQAVLVKPISPLHLIQHIKWVHTRQHKLKLVGERYVVEGISRKLEAQRDKQRQLSAARDYQAEQAKLMNSIQDDVDRILSSSF